MFRWYVVNTYSGHENKVKVNLEHRIESMGQRPRFRAGRRHRRAVRLHAPSVSRAASVSLAPSGAVPLAGSSRSRGASSRRSSGRRRTS